jgi:hypothetical protein
MTASNRWRRKLEAPTSTREQRSKRKARPKPGFLVAVTPSTRSWNLVVGFLTDWDGLRAVVVRAANPC